MTSLLALALVLLAVALLILSRTKTRELGPLFQWLRLFFPSWRFFEDFGPTPVLSARVMTGSQEFGPWQETLPAAPRSAGMLFLNPFGNLRLALMDLVDRLLADAARLSPQELEQSLSFRLVRNAVEFSLRKQGHQGTRRYQFKISLQDSAGTEDLLVSETFESEGA